MQENRELTSQELSELRELNSKYNTIVFSLGEAEIVIRELEEKLEKAKMEQTYLMSDYTTLKQQSEALTAKLSEKYGSAKVDLDTGKIEPI